MPAWGTGVMSPNNNFMVLPPSNNRIISVELLHNKIRHCPSKVIVQAGCDPAGHFLQLRDWQIRGYTGPTFCSSDVEICGYVSL